MTSQDPKPEAEAGGAVAHGGTDADRHLAAPGGAPALRGGGDEDHPAAQRPKTGSTPAPGLGATLPSQASMQADSPRSCQSAQQSPPF